MFPFPLLLSPDTFCAVVLSSLSLLLLLPPPPSSFFFSFTTYGVVDGVHSYKKWTWGKDSPSFLSLNLYIPQHNLHTLYFYQELVFCLWAMMCASFWYCLLCTWPLLVASQVRNSTWRQWSQSPGLITALAQPRSAPAWFIPAASSLLLPVASH